MGKNRTNYTKYNTKTIEDESKELEMTIENLDVHDDIIEDEIEESEMIVEEQKTKVAFVKIPKGSKLNVRSSKSFEFEPITQISDMQEVRIIDEDDSEWYKICTATGIEGYIQKKYVTFEIN